MVPGDVLEYHMTRIKRRKNMWWFRGEAKVGGEIVAEAELGAMIARGLSLPRIDPSSRVAAGARIADDVEVGPFCTIGPNVELCAGVKLLSHVNIAGVTVIGEQTVVYPFASLGTAPQSTGYRGGATRLTIGHNCQIREGVTINTGTEDGGEVTTVGDRCFLMANSHVGHDCHVGNDVTFANGAVLGGHVSVADHVFIGGNTAVHQFVRIGEGAMLGGSERNHPRRHSIRVCVRGARRSWSGSMWWDSSAGSSAGPTSHRIRSAYRTLFFGDDTFAERLERTS